jgi:hypothetical protein
VPTGSGGSALLVGPGGGRSWLLPLLVVLVPGDLAAYAAAFGLGLAVQRSFIIFPMRCSALALGWM